MILNQLELTNFRCFGSLLVPLDRHLNVFVGVNGSGKTAVLDAIALVLAPILNHLPVKNIGIAPSLVTADIRLTGEDLCAAFLHLVTTGVPNGDHGIVWDRTIWRDRSPTTKKEAPANRKELKELHRYLNEITDAQNAEQAYQLPVFAHYRANRSLHDSKHGLSTQERFAPFRRLAALENALDVKTDFGRAVKWFDQLEQRELREQRDKNPSVGSCAIDAVRRAIRSMIPQAENPRIDAKSGRFVVDLNDDGHPPIPLHLGRLSDGYQAMLGVVMDFALRLALANPSEDSAVDVLASEAILIIDEVDLHLHPAWQQRVIPDLRRTFPNAQLILTTHSPQVATTVPSEGLRILSGGQLWTAPPGTDGAEAARMLEDVFQVCPRPDLPMARRLADYLRLVDQRLWDSPQAQHLRQELDDWSQGQEPMLLEADLRIENMKWEAGQ